jgi:hypothetical protein
MVVVTDVSGQHIGPIFEGQPVREECRKQVMRYSVEDGIIFYARMHTSLSRVFWSFNEVVTRIL